MASARWLLGLWVFGVACGTTQVFQVEPPPGGGPDGGSSEGGTAKKDVGDDDDVAGDDDDVVGDGGLEAAPAACDGPCPPEVLASSLHQATALGVDKQNVYFAIEGSATGNVFQCPKTGCVGDPIALGPGYAYGIASIGGNAIWGDYFTGKLWSCAIGGCNDDPTAIATNEAEIRGVWSDGSKVYWSSKLDGGSIRSCDPANCTPVSVVKAIGTGVQILSVEAGTVAWISGGKARACAIADCSAPTVLGAGVAGIVLQGSKAYWVTTAKTIVSCPIGGCNETPLLIGSSSSPAALATDGNLLFWRDDLYETIYRCSAEGCGVSPAVWATKQTGQPGGQLRLDGPFLYWTTTTRVMRQAK